MRKNIPSDVARQVKQLGEEIVEEIGKQPAELARTAGRQIGILPEESETQITPQVIEKKEKERQEKLVFWRGRQRELIAETHPRKVPEKKEEKKMKSLPEVPAKRPRGLLLGLKRRKEESHPELAGRRVGG